VIKTLKRGWGAVKILNVGWKATMKLAGAGVLWLAVCSAFALEGVSFDNESLKQLKDSSADYSNIVGSMLIIKGNVYIPFGDMTLYADSAVIDIESGDIEVIGNIRAYLVTRSNATISIEDLVKLRRDPFVSATIEGYTINPLGEQMVDVAVVKRGDQIKASRMAGNLHTGVMEMNDVELVFKGFGARAEHGVRKPGGEITLERAEISSCSYLAEDNAHYSFFAGKVHVTPHKTANFGIRNKDNDMGEHSILAYNVQARAYGVPFLWFPIFYKPKDESPGLFKFQIGDNGDWGFFVLSSKVFNISDNPYSSVKLHLDYYGMRGWGWGAGADLYTADSRTDVFGYGIYDMRPYYSSEVENGRLKIPHMRYDFRITNVTHIIPRLDFRGHFEMVSDMYFLEDFYRYSFNNNPEPATFAALEYQFDALSTAVYFRPRVNDFFTTVERLPELRVDVPRQQLFGTNLYYQSETTADYLQMRWRDYDRGSVYGTPDAKNYAAFRFDTVHFLYYPIKLGPLNLIPRAGVRFTGYSESSKRKVSSSDLNTMYVISRPEGEYNLAYNQYDKRGNARGRFIGEFGMEANTKISRTFNDVRNAFWKLDGLRHVVVPYVNYTFIPKPSEDRDHLYAFDDIDRIEKQHFFRLGLRNRFETRRGNFGGEQLAEIFSMENYWDIHLEKHGGFNYIGDFCTKLNFNPGNGIHFDTVLSLDVGDNGGHNISANRRGRDAGRPGIGGKLVNKWEVNFRYDLFTDCSVTLSYVYQDAYASRSAYSMGSTLSEIDGGSYFDRYYNTRSQTIRFGFTVPLSMDHSFRGAYDIYYDFEVGGIREQRIKLVKTLHCWEVAAEFAYSRKYNSDGKLKGNYSFMATAYLTGLMGPAQQVQSALKSGMDELGSQTTGTSMSGLNF